MKSAICFFTFIFLPTFALADVPTNSQIINSIANKNIASSQDITISDTTAITLKNGEQAFLSSVNYGDAARNFWGGYVLTRPLTGHSMIVADQKDGFGGQTNKFQVSESAAPLGGKPHSWVVLGQSDSGQGDMDTTLYIVEFDGWKPVVKYKTSYHSNDGSCGVGTSSPVCIDQMKFLNPLEYTNTFIETESKGTSLDPDKKYKFSYSVKPININ